MLLQNRKIFRWRFTCSFEKTISLCITVGVDLILAGIFTATLLLEDYFPFKKLLKNGC